MEEKGSGTTECSHCHKKSHDNLFVCGQVDCLRIICAACRLRRIHQHAGSDLISSYDLSDNVIRPYLDRNGRQIADGLLKLMSRLGRAQSVDNVTATTTTRLDKTDEVKRDIRLHCTKMRQIIEEAEMKLLSLVETTEEEFRSDATSSSEEDLKSLEQDYKHMIELRTMLDQKITREQQFQLFALMKRYEFTLDSVKSSTESRKQWEQTYMSFLPNEDALQRLKQVAYSCGKIKYNLQLSVDLPTDKSASGLSGMTLMGDHLAIADKFNKTVKIFACPARERQGCSQRSGGESVRTRLINEYRDPVNDREYQLKTPVDLTYDPISKLIFVVDEQDNSVVALDSTDSYKLRLRLEVKRPNAVALSNKLIVVSSEYEKLLTAFRRPNGRKMASMVLKDHPQSVAVNSKTDIAVCTLHGTMSIHNSDLKEQHVVASTVDGCRFRPQRTCSMYNDRFLACDDQRVIEVQTNGVRRRTILISGLPGTSIPELPRALACDNQRSIFMGFGRYVKVFPVPVEVLLPEYESESNSSSNVSDSMGGEDLFTQTIK